MPYGFPTKRVVLAAIKHESHTFNRFPTTLDLFRRQGYHLGREVASAYRDTGLEMAGFLAAAARFGWWVQTPISASATSGGRVTAEAMANFLAVLGDGLRAAMPLDGVLLALHGAMAAEEDDDADGTILAMVRGIVGDAVPIAVTFDLHANVSDRTAGLADVIVSYRTNPHTDHYPTAVRAAELLHRAMTGEVRPRTVVARAATLVAFDRGRTHTGHGPMMDALADARRLERMDPGVWCVSINSGFSHADVWQAGPSVTVTGDAAPAQLQAIADGIMVAGFHRRAEESVRLATVADAVAAMGAGRPGAPVVVADYTDAPGGGAYGDATVLLRAMIAAGLQASAFGAIWDPATAAQAVAAGLGAHIAVKLGGWIDPEFSDSPIAAMAEVICLSDGDYVHEGPYAPGTVGSFGASAILRIGGVDVIVSTENKNILDQQQFKIFGIEPSRCASIGLKCMHGFRAAFEPVAARVISCDAGGLTTYDYRRLPFRHLRRPIWPLDNVE
ncbi:MAG: M81 family metallopeptidase [Acetobacteraceae bacterium]|nr:M81 family metallopeptidase [Acetobacteraceae bacterium]